ncbi:MAG: hypothetical protein ACE5FC_09445, partial [Myxococcota bacterium]
LTLEEPRPAATLRRFHACGLLRALEPSFTLGDACARGLDRVSDALGWFRLLYTGEEPAGWIPAWLALTAGLEGSARRRLEARLGLTGGRAARIDDARSGAARALRAPGKLWAGPPSAIAKTLRPLSVEGLLWLMACTEDEAVGRAVSRYITGWRRVKPVLSGVDLLALGFQEGPAVGTALRALRDARLDGKIATREDEIARARRLLESHKSR